MAEVKNNFFRRKRVQGIDFPMKMHRIKSLVMGVTLSAVALSGASFTAADNLDQAFKLGQARTAAAQKSPQKVDKLADETRDRVQDY